MSISGRVFDFDEPILISLFLRRLQIEFILTSKEFLSERPRPESGTYQTVIEDANSAFSIVYN